MKKRALVVLQNGVLALKGIYALKACCYEIHVLATKRIACAQLSRCVKSFDIIPSGMADEAMLDKIRGYNPDIIFPAEIESSGWLYRLSKLDPRLPFFPCSNENVLDELDNKDKFISLLYRHEINHPASTLLSSPFSVNAFPPERIGFPIVAKTLYGESGRGVSFLKSRKEFDRHLERLAERDWNGRLQLQEFISGDVYGLNICAVDGVICAWSVYKKLDEDTLLFLDRFDICKLVAGLINDLKFSGLANFDLILTRDQKIFFIECNPRVWYTIQADRFLGLNFVEVGIANRLAPVAAEKTAKIIGTYVFPKRTLKMLLNPLNFWKVNYHSLSGLFEVSSDPVAQLAKVFNGILKK